MVVVNVLVNCLLIVIQGEGVVLLVLGDICEVSKCIVVVVVKQVQVEGKVLYISDEVLNDVIEVNFWFLCYCVYCWILF